LGLYNVVGGFVEVVGAEQLVYHGCEDLFPLVELYDDLLGAAQMQNSLS
jgi:hypothetical protein